MPPDHNTPRAELERYLQALRESAEHHKDGMERTEADYQEFPYGYKDCALCCYYGTTGYIDKCDDCFLDDSFRHAKVYLQTTNCSTEVQKAIYARKDDNFDEFHKAEVALYNRICAEIARVEELIKSKKSKRHQFKVGDTVVWDGVVYDRNHRVLETNSPERVTIEAIVDRPDRYYKISRSGWNVFDDQLSPVKKQPRTVVTVWHKVDLVINGELDRIPKKSSYCFEGTPDVDRVITETLGQGALAVKLECDEEFGIKDCHAGVANSCYFWKRAIGRVIQRSFICGEKDGIYSFSLNKDGGTCKYISDFDIESAIKVYLEKREPKEPEFKVGDDEIDDYYTREFAGELVRAYEDKDGAIRLYLSDGNWYWVCASVARALLANSHIPIMSWEQVQKYYNGEFKAPTK